MNLDFIKVSDLHKLAEPDSEQVAYNEWKEKTPHEIAMEITRVAGILNGLDNAFNYAQQKRLEEKRVEMRAELKQIIQSKREQELMKSMKRTKLLDFLQSNGIAIDEIIAEALQKENQPK